jgi:hypothetical protein
MLFRSSSALRLCLAPSVLNFSCFYHCSTGLCCSIWPSHHSISILTPLGPFNLSTSSTVHCPNCAAVCTVRNHAADQPAVLFWQVLASHSSSQQLLPGPQFISIIVDPAAIYASKHKWCGFLTPSPALFAHLPQLSSKLLGLDSAFSAHVRSLLRTVV